VLLVRGEWGYFTVRKNGRSTVAITIALAGLLVMIGLLSRSSSLAGQETDDRARRLEILRSVPYTSVTEDKVNPDGSGVIIHKPDKAYRGYNICCSRVSPEVLLIDMAGEVVHRWTYPQIGEGIWDHVLMLDNGDIVVIVKFEYLLKLDWHSNLVWMKEIEAHHDIALGSDSTLYVIKREVKPYRGLVVRFPSIVHLTYDGDEIGTWSTYDNLEAIGQTFDRRSFLDTVLDSMLSDGSWPEISDSIASLPEAGTAPSGETRFDYFHLNTITVLPETPLGKRDSRFKAGNLLICFRNVNQIAVLERDGWDPVWVWGEGVLDWPHHPTMLPDGRILMFDNGFRRKFSKLLEIDPVDGSVEWEYVGTPRRSFFTSNKGSSQRLPNGTTLVCQGNRGRVFEVTRDGEIVWEWLNPMLKEGRRVQVYRMLRLAPEIVEPLLAADE
jgi:hypothetical protein